MGTLKKNRQSGLELLRILSALGVVILHYSCKDLGNGFLFVEKGSLNEKILVLFDCIFIYSVNIFVMISGYFLVKTQKRSLSKAIELMFQVIVFEQIPFFYAVFKGNQIFTIKNFLFSLVPNNYFASLYIALYIISPYLNLIFRFFEKKGNFKFVLTFFLIFSVWSMTSDFFENTFGINAYGLTPVSAYGTQAGYTIINFILVYLVGAYFSLYGFPNLKNWQFFLSVAIIIFIEYIWLLKEFSLNLEERVSINYNNPTVIIVPVLLICIFSKLKFNSKIINELAKGAFACYLFHLRIVRSVNIERAVQGPTSYMILHVLIVAVSSYIISYLVFKIYYYITLIPLKKLRPIIDKINISVEVDDIKKEEKNELGN